MVGSYTTRERGSTLPSRAIHEIIGVPTESLSKVQQGPQQQAETSTVRHELITWSDFQSGQDTDDQCLSSQVARMLRCRNWIRKCARKVGEGGKLGSQYQREKGTCKSLEVAKIVVSSPLGKKHLRI